MKMGVIAEDYSDVAVIRQFTLSMLKPYLIGFNHFVGHSCGKLRRKCPAWAKILARQGCKWIAVVHDLDTYDEKKLHDELKKAITPVRVNAKVVLIPKREIEAWLLYDGAAIATAFNESKKPRLPGDPELLLDPKKYLRDLIWSRYRKDYLNTVHNEFIAKEVDVSVLRRSRSFAPHTPFVDQIRKKLQQQRLRK